MATITRFEDIQTWQKGRELKQSFYRHSKRGDFVKDFALREQIRRAVIFITANIAEGFERSGNREFIQFLSQSKGSSGEVQDHLYPALDENYISQKEFDALYAQAAEVAKLTGSFMNYFRQSEVRGQKIRGARP
jgi:four helix bundle protein